MNFSGLGIVALICLIILVLVIEIVAVVLIAGAVASMLGFTGILWWAVAIVVFMIINGLLGLVL